MVGGEVGRAWEEVGRESGGEGRAWKEVGRESGGEGSTGSRLLLRHSMPLKGLDKERNSSTWTDITPLYEAPRTMEVQGVQ